MMIDLTNDFDTESAELAVSRCRNLTEVKATYRIHRVIRDIIKVFGEVPNLTLPGFNLMSLINVAEKIKHRHIRTDGGKSYKCFVVTCDETITQVITIANNFKEQLLFIRFTRINGVVVLLNASSLISLKRVNDRVVADQGTFIYNDTPTPSVYKPELLNTIQIDGVSYNEVLNSELNILPEV